jgi:hypothetical protein
MGGVAIGVASELSTQGRVARRLDSRLAARWDSLGGLGRYTMGRQLRRGRALEADDAELGAEVAAALRAVLARRWFLWVFGVLGALFLLLTAVTLAAGKYTLAGVEAVIALLLLWTAAWQPYARRRLAAAEKANRELADGYEG